MKRREFVAIVVGALAAMAPLAGRAQRAAKPYRIGLLPDFWKAFVGLFVQAMGEHGWKEGRDFTLLRSGFEYGPGIDKAAARIVGEKPDLIYTMNTGYAVEAHRLTKSIPIVMLSSGFPVEAGLAASLRRPGRNVTGNSHYAGTGIFGKLLEFLREAKPGAKRVAVLWSYVPPMHPREEIEPCYRELQTAASLLGRTLQIIEVSHPDGVAGALEKVASGRAEAMFVTSGLGITPVMERVTKFAVAKRIPTIFDIRWIVPLEPGPVLIYSASWTELTRQAVSYVVRILADGLKPGDLPIQQPSKFELVVNLKTAKSIGLALPKSLLARADEVIE